MSVAGASVADARDALGRTGGLRLGVFSDAIPGRNGVGTYYDDLVEHLRDRGAHVRLVAPPRDEAPKWYRSLRLPGDDTQFLHVPPILETRRALARFAPNVVLSATPGFYGFLGYRLARSTGASFCLAFHTDFPALVRTYWRAPLGTLGCRVLRFWDRLLFRRAEVVVVPSGDLIEGALADDSVDVRVMGTPTPPDFLRRPPEPLGSRLRTVAFVGRLAPEKRVDELLDAAVALPDVEFRVLGDGPLRADVEAAGDNVTFRPWASRPEVMEWIDAADLIVLPSKHETFGTAAFEAMVRGRPALVSEACGITGWPDLAEGLFVMRPAESLADAIGRLRGLPARARAQRAERGRTAARRFNDRSVDGWVELLVEVAGVDAAA